MQRLRETLAIALIGLLPFHALLVTVGTTLIVGPGHAPMTALSLWKEVVLGILLFIAFVEWMRSPTFTTDILDRLVIGLLLLSLIVTGMTHGDWKLYAYGFKYDCIPLVAFLVLRRVAWSDAFFRRVGIVLLGVAGIVAVYGMISMYLPQSFFAALGYSDLHSLYQPDAPLAAFQQIGGSALRRVQSTMSGPNQMGLWLLIPLSILLTQKRDVRSWKLGVGVFVVVAMLLTLSRSAILAAGAIVMMLLWQRLPRKKFWFATGFLLVLSFVISVSAYFIAPNIAVRAASTRDHLIRPLQAIETIVQHPFGLGLGAAGPASNRISDTCVYLAQGDDPLWASVHKNLCVFVGDSQVQPTDRVCQCPFLPENWYLQIGVEMGVLGLVLFIALTVLMLRRLPSNRFVFFAFLGISIAALFLHAWEDSAVAYTMWVLLAAYLSLHRHHQAVPRGR